MYRYIEQDAVSSVFCNCNILYGPNGADLSAFKCTSSAIDKPLERSFGSIYKWLQRGFRVDPETHVMTVHALVNWEVEGDLWELMMIPSTDDWQKYMQEALERGWSLAILVQIREKTQNEIQHGADQEWPEATHALELLACTSASHQCCVSSSIPINHLLPPNSQEYGRSSHVSPDQHGTHAAATYI